MNETIRKILGPDHEPEASLAALVAGCRSDLAFGVADIRRGRAVDMRWFDVTYADGRGVLKGLYFAGRGRWLPRWCEVYVNPAAMGPTWLEDSACLFEGLGDLVGGGGRLFVYYEHPALASTPRLLDAKAPPPATELGWLLWQAGARWYKDWYFPEGGAEGGRKLQGSLPADDAIASAEETERMDELRRFIARTDVPATPDWQAAVERARRLVGAGAEAHA